MVLLEEMRNKLRELNDLLDEKLEKIPRKNLRNAAVDFYNNLSMKYNFLGIPDVETRDFKIVNAFINKLKEL